MKYFYILNNYHLNSPFFIASSSTMLAYILSVKRNAICYNFILKKIINKWISLHKYIKYYKNINNLRERELGIIKRNF